MTLARRPMRIEGIRQRLRSLGSAPGHEQRVLRLWAQAVAQDSGSRPIETFLPQTLRTALPALIAELHGLARLRSEHLGADGSTRLLVELSDGLTVESVLLPRGGLCVSTQVGCAVGCVFCMTGRDGLLRQLGSAEIVAQVALARGISARRATARAPGAVGETWPACLPSKSEQADLEPRRAAPSGGSERSELGVGRFTPVRKVVFMGMGEPAHNLDNVLEAIELLGTAGGVGHKNLVFSTVGDRRVFERLPLGAVKPALALSLHSTKPELRAALLPRAPRIAPAELVRLGERYARATGYPVQIQWTLLDGINDGDDELDGIAALLAGKHAMLNLIPYNAVDGLALRRPSLERAVAISRSLNRRGILTRLRRSAGQDVEAGCGQLRARALAAVTATR